MRVFLDTNVLVSAFATRGVCVDVLRVVLAEHTQVTGEVVLEELGRVLRKRIGLPPQAVKEIDEFLREHEVVPKPAARATLPKRDPDDQWVVASAIQGRADVLVTGDRDLLDIARVAPIRIVDPRGFWDLLRTNG
ncbi:MAG: putative toxin-antitoxin system toxin component, PIN family [Candidatus Rokubacteria bacterium RBG_16_73_20]|nr:MAG: putative toxin-antitoxin system toxin component, PIN family [Candidatus Rokubacteria bacterium GWA2_73_35]OGK91565.1 MAG: putative toxin-antitoxin system toxin component, PIN family [Candidatus Rokubacteria bacterium RBG_16_73_20]HBH01166.1 putative toxin-antitoxin system toxin component, PIN family [Candidatus Rokubacteria bacterium]